MSMEVDALTFALGGFAFDHRGKVGISKTIGLNRQSIRQHDLKEEHQ
jgi:hypothetical protein